MGRLAPMGLRPAPGPTLPCALGHPNTCRACSQPLICTCECHKETEQMPAQNAKEHTR